MCRHEETNCVKYYTLQNCYRQSGECVPSIYYKSKTYEEGENDLIAE